MTRLRTVFRRGAIGVFALAAIAVSSGGIALAVIYPKVPDVAQLSDYRPKLPLRIYSAEGTLIGEFGEERRQLVPVGAMPKALKDAVVAVEDARFYTHGGIDPIGLARALLVNAQNLGQGLRQGASTLTQQVARNVYLSSERTLTRKVYEAVLALKLERQLGKDRILEIYLNQIYLGHRAYGFAAAAETYFGKPLADLTLAECAMLAGLPKAPVANNPIVNPARARSRQLHVLARMERTGVVDAAAAAAARAEPLRLRDPSDPKRPHAEYVAEAVRQQMQATYGESIYTRGLSVHTTVRVADQAAAYRALRQGLMDYERRQPYRGPEAVVDLPAGAGPALDDAVDQALAGHPDRDDIGAAVVLQADAGSVVAVRADGDVLRLSGDGVRSLQAALSPRAPAQLRVRRGAVIRVMRREGGGGWDVVQLPEVQGAFVALDPKTGAVQAMVGGFDFGRSPLNRATRAWRQPGSSFKPFIYSAALEKGFTPATVVNDAPLPVESAADGAAPWTPRNFDGRHDGPMSLRRALQQSKNLVTVRLLEAIGTGYAQDWITRFGFDRERHPAVLPMGLGAGSVTPMQLAGAYAVFANGGFRVDPYLVTRVTDRDGRVLSETTAPLLDEGRRAIPARNAYLTASLLQSVVQGGTAVKARQVLQRDDLYGKTGTTNASVDTWFAGFQPQRVGVAWVGYDTPRPLGAAAGRGETGGSLSLPIWTGYMRAVLKGVPVATLPEPAGLVHVAGETYFDDFAPGRGVESLGLDSAPAEIEEPAEPAQPVARDRILDWFR